MSADRDVEMWQSSLTDPDALQERCLLHRIVAPNADSRYGRAHGFLHIRSVQDYQRSLPIVTYRDLEPQIAQITAGERGVLTCEPVRRFFATSGSTGTAKLVPVTSSLIADKARAFGVYWSLLFRDHPDAERGRVVGNFSDSAGTSQVTCGLPMTSEGAYWSAVGAATQKRGRSPLPACVGRIADADSRYYAAARILLEEDVSLLMALNPSTLLLLFRKMSGFADDLIRDIARGGIGPDLAIDREVRDFVTARYPGNPVRADQLRSLLRTTEPALAAHEMWPNLALVVSWRSPMQVPYLRLLAPHLAAIAQRDYLLMASEAVIAIPTSDGISGGVLATPFHFFEFIPEADSAASDPPTLLASELEVGQRYVVVLSTTGGLYRYNIGDVVRVTGRHHRTPVVEFLHRTGSTCSLTGEKLTEDQVMQAIAAAAPGRELALEGFTLHPAPDGFPRYVLVVEAAGSSTAHELAALLAAFERELAGCNIEYSAKRRSQRLGAPELWLVERGSYARLRARRIAAGANDGQIKPTHLTRDMYFSAGFSINVRITAN